LSISVGGSGKEKDKAPSLSKPHFLEVDGVWISGKWAERKKRTRLKTRGGESRRDSGYLAHRREGKNGGERVEDKEPERRGNKVRSRKCRVNGFTGAGFPDKRSKAHL